MLKRRMVTVKVQVCVMIMMCYGSIEFLYFGCKHHLATDLADRMLS